MFDILLEFLKKNQVKLIEIFLNAPHPVAVGYLDVGQAPFK